MKIKNITLLTSTAIAGLLLSSASFAQTAKFTGPSIALTGSINSVDNQIKNSNISYDIGSTLLDIESTFNPSLSTNNTSTGLDLNYGFAAGNNFVLGVGLTYDFGKGKSSHAYDIQQESGGEDNVKTGITVGSQLKNHRSIYIQPTYVVNKDSAMFAKFGRHYAKANVNSAFCSDLSIYDDGDCDGLIYTQESKKTIHGWGYGLGLKTFLTENLFVQAEGGIVKYSSYNLPDAVGNEDAYLSTNTKTTVKNATISIGYKF
jgi:opacity protein-like surface antigen